LPVSPKKHKIYASGEGRHRTIIVVTNNQIDSLLLRQLSDEVTETIEVVSDKAKTIIASMYFDINREIECDLKQIETIIHHAKGTGVLLAIDSNATSTSWHDTQTNTRGRILEEFLISKPLYIINEESTRTTFRNSRGSSNIDLTIISNQLLRVVKNWEVSDQESCSDYIIIKFAIGQGSWSRSKQESQEVKYMVKSKDIDKFQGHLLRLLEERLNTRNTEEGLVDLNETLSKRGKEKTYIKKLIEEFPEDLKAVCDMSFKKQRTTKKTITKKSVLWWTDELTVLRKRTDALRR
jgi:hypothetical protein